MPKELKEKRIYNPLPFLDQYGSFRVKIDVHSGRKQEEEKQRLISSIKINVDPSFPTVGVGKDVSFSFSGNISMKMNSSLIKEEGEIIEGGSSSSQPSVIKKCQHSNCRHNAINVVYNPKHNLVWCFEHLKEFQKISCQMKNLEKELEAAGNMQSTINTDFIGSSVNIIDKIIDLRTTISTNFYEKIDDAHAKRISYLQKKKKEYKEYNGGNRITLISSNDYNQFKIPTFFSFNNLLNFHFRPNF